jgi:hypothetical protein
VCFYFRRNVDRRQSKMAFQYHSNLMATLSLETNCGIINIHNIYNSDKDAIPINSMASLWEMEGEHIVAGDFNLYHPHWGRARAKRIDWQAIELHNFCLQSMHLVTKVSAKTWEKTDNSDQWSTIDLTFVSLGLSTRVDGWELLSRRELMDTKADHEPICTTLNVTAPRMESAQRCFKRADHDQLKEAVRKGLEAIGLPPLLDEDQIDVLITATCENVPFVNPSPRASSLMTPDVKAAIKAAGEARR